MRVYISGPISGHDINERRSCFAKVKDTLKASGHEVFNPLENGLPEKASTSEHMKTDIKALLNCDCIYMMERWNHSAGCQTEYLVAMAYGMPVWFEGVSEPVIFK